MLDYCGGCWVVPFAWIGHIRQVVVPAGRDSGYNAAACVHPQPLPFQRKGSSWGVVKMCLSPVSDKWQDLVGRYGQQRAVFNNEAQWTCVYWQHGNFGCHGNKILLSIFAVNVGKMTLVAMDNRFFFYLHTFINTEQQKKKNGKSLLWSIKLVTSIKTVKPAYNEHWIYIKPVWGPPH